MQWLEWLKVLAMFFGLFAAIAAAVIFVYFTGINFLARIKFGRTMLIWLSVSAFVLFLAASVAFAVNPAGNFSFLVAVPAAVSGVAISVLSARCLRVMIGE